MLKQGLSIDTAFYPPYFYLDNTFKSNEPEEGYKVQQEKSAKFWFSYTSHVRITVKSKAARNFLLGFFS